MPILRNPRHEQFAREYVKTGIGAEAYRRVYPTAHPISTARVCASQLLTKPNIAIRTAELRQAMAKRADITEDKILTDYQFAIDHAKGERDEAGNVISPVKPADIIAGATAQAKLVGLLKDRIETRNVDNFGEMDTVEEVLQAVAERAGPEVALALAKAVGHDGFVTAASSSTQS